MSASYEYPALQNSAITPAHTLIDKIAFALIPVTESAMLPSNIKQIEENLYTLNQFLLDEKVILIIIF